MADLGHCFIAVDPKCFAPGFEERLSDLMESLRQMPPNDPDKPVLVAGDSERLHMKAVDEAGGIRYIQDQLDTCEKVAQDLNIRPLQPLAK
jgi:LDH2 family malate/lactate/ureidoglycolate dehydrogenase